MTLFPCDGLDAAPIGFVLGVPPLDLDQWEFFHGATSMGLAPDGIVEAAPNLLTA